VSEAEGPWVEPEEARCGLLLKGPEAPGPDFAAELGAVLATGAVVAYVAGGEREAARTACADHNVACLTLDTPDPGADGVHLRDPGKVAEARRRLGPRAIIGASCGRSRHLAMVAGEEGADYVSFAGPDSEELALLCQWWSELFFLPCAVEVDRPGPEVAGYIEAGADFIAVGQALWDHPDGAAAAARLLFEQIDEARRQRQDHA
jgi:thiamine-phosphate pyrophosphorylase